MCSNQLPQETVNVDPPESQVSNDDQHASDILQFTAESTPPPKSEDVSEMNGSSKQTSKSKRSQWLTVSI